MSTPEEKPKEGSDVKQNVSIKKTLSVNQSQGVSSTGQVFFLDDKKDNPDDPKKLANVLKDFLFVDVKSKRDKIQYIGATGNFDTRKPPPPFYIILPNSRGRILWDVFICMMTLWNLFVVPIDIGWNLECFTANEGQVIHNLYTVITIVNLLDILINFITAFLSNKNEYIYDLELIFKHYLGEWFIIDLIGIIPFDKVKPFTMNDCFQSYLSPTKLWYFFFLLRLFKIGGYFDMIERLMSKYALIIRLSKLMLTVIYFSHLVGNIFCGNSPTVGGYLASKCSNLAIYSDVMDCSRTLIGGNFSSFYFYSVFIGIYWVMMNELSVTTNWERMTQYFVLAVSIGLNASIFGNVAVFLDNISFGLSPILQSKVDIMKEYMSFMEFDDIFITQISEYHLNLWMKQRNMLYPADFFDDLSLCLHKSLLVDQWKKSFFEISNFVKLISYHFLLDMVPKLKPKIYMRNDVMITEGDNTCEVYFMSSTAVTHIKIGGEWVKNLEPGDYFGEIAIFLVSKRRTASVICLKDSDFLILEGDVFEKFLRDYPDDYASIKGVAIQKFLSSMKLYPTSLFAKIVPNMEKQNYMIRRCIYLPTSEEVEDQTAKVTNTNNNIINLDQIMGKIELVNIIFNDIKSKLNKMNSYFAEEQ